MIDDLISRVAENLAGRVSGPMKFRLYLQPAMATIYAIRDGLKDARNSRPAYFWSLFTEPALRPALIKEGWQAVGKVFILAIIIDAVYQYVVFHWFYPGEAIMVAIILAVLPYLLIRGPVNRIARR